MAAKNLEGNYRPFISRYAATVPVMATKSYRNYYLFGVIMLPPSSREVIGAEVELKQVSNMFGSLFLLKL